MCTVRYDCLLHEGFHSCEAAAPLFRTGRTPAPVDWWLEAGYPRHFTLIHPHRLTFSEVRLQIARPGVACLPFDLCCIVFLELINTNFSLFFLAGFWIVQAQGSARREVSSWIFVGVCVCVGLGWGVDRFTCGIRYARNSMPSVWIWAIESLPRNSPET